MMDLIYPNNAYTRRISEVSSVNSPGMSRSNSFVSSVGGRARGSFCHVAVRIRPQDDDDVQPIIWDVNPRDSTIELLPEFSERRRQETFNFDSVFQGSDNQLLYNVTIKDLVKDAMEGIDGTVFAYGQTATGKTYSMMGYEEQPGIIPQAVEDVFSFIRDVVNANVRCPMIVNSLCEFLTLKFTTKESGIC
jgi:Kinesin motor domain